MFTIIIGCGVAIVVGVIALKAIFDDLKGI